MIQDIYPSREGREPCIVEREDPVVYQEYNKECPLTQEQFNSYNEKGFLVLDQLFSAKEVEEFLNEIKQLKKNKEIVSSDLCITEPESKEVRSVFMIHSLSNVFAKLMSNPKIKDIARFLLNDEVYIHQSRVNYKPGFNGKEFYWHSDFETWHTEDGMPRMRALSMSVSLTENYHHNGSLMLIPGSHRDYGVCSGYTPENHFKASLKKQEYGVPDNEVLKSMVDKGGIYTATGKPGSVVIFDCNTMHGSNGNITPHPRSNIFFVYNAISNKVVDPFCKKPNRPEFICSRDSIETI